MPTFVYNALDARGKPAAGEVSAASRAAAIDAVVGRGLFPTSVAPKGDGEADGPRLATSARPRAVSAAQIDAFTRQLANLLAAGVPLARSLQVLRREASNPAAAALWRDVYDAIAGGSTLADALAKFTNAFPPLYIAMVRAGETGGFLDVVLGQIADYRAREAELKGRVRAAMVYPCVLAALAVAVVILLLTFFIPRFTGIFAEFGAKLPLLTRAIIAASGFMTSHGPVIAVLLVVGFFVARRSLATPAGRRFIDDVSIRAPVFGIVLARFALVRFARMLGTLLASGVPLVTALRVAREAIGNQTLADTMDHAIEQVKRGASLARGLALSPRLFPPSVVEMIAVAEETSRLDRELQRLATTLESEVDRRLRTLVSLIEPAILIVMAAIVGTIVIGMILPVFTLQELIK